MASAAHCAYCFDVLLQNFDNKVRITAPETNANTPTYPMFVTWKKRAKDGRSYVLRGCIGTFAGQDLLGGLKRFALTSALKDSRFQPVTASELSLLSCDVSLLTDFEDVNDVDDWTVGTHGIQIEFADPHKRDITYSATYLPEVALEQGWSRSEALSELVAKSGYRSSVTAALKKTIKLTRYQSKHASLTYSQYIALRKPPSSTTSSASISSDSETADDENKDNSKHMNGINGKGNSNGNGNGNSTKMNGTSSNSNSNGNGNGNGKAKAEDNVQKKPNGVNHALTNGVNGKNHS
jgi:uncharacterized protein (TIGR00296 family)